MKPSLKSALAFSVAFLSSAGALAGEAPASQAAQTVKSLVCPAASGKVEFLATGKPSLLKIRGQAAGPDCRLQLNDNVATGELIFDLNQLDTGIDTRTSHMKEKYLETGRFQKATLTLDALTLPPAAGEGKTVEFTGMLELHGVKKPVKGTALIERGNAGRVNGAQADFEILLPDYGIAIPKFAGVIVSEKVAIHVQLERLEARAQ